VLYWKALEVKEDEEIFNVGFGLLILDVCLIGCCQDE